jgi:hypothetical protein
MGATSTSDCCVALTGVDVLADCVQRKVIRLLGLSNALSATRLVCLGSRAETAVASRHSTQVGSMVGAAAALARVQLHH